MGSRKISILFVAALSAALVALSVSAFAAGTGSQFRVSTMGAAGNSATDASTPAVARNYRNDEFLVVWAGDNSDGDTQIWGKRVNDKGQLVDDQFAISRSAVPDGARNPTVAWNSLENQYLVAWEQDTVTGTTGGGGGGGLLGLGGGGGTVTQQRDTEIYIRVLDSDGNPKNQVPAPISDMGTAGQAGFTATEPDVAFNSRANVYEVVWTGIDDAPGSQEIYGQRLEADGDQVGGNDPRISDMGPNADYDAASPSVAYNIDSGRYLVVWSGDDDQDGVVKGEKEIYGQGLDASGTETGTHNFRISDMGGSGDPERDALEPDVVYSQALQNFLVVWSGDDDANNLIDVYGQFVATDGDPTGDNDFKITSVGGNGGAHTPALSANSDADDFLVTWAGGSRDLGQTETEIFGQRLSSKDSGVDAPFQISQMGTNSDSRFGAVAPAVAHSQKEDQYFVFWSGDDPGEGDDAFEIYGRRATAASASIGPASPPAATGPSAAGGDTIPPVMYFSVEPRSFRASEGTTFQIPLSENSTVTISIDKRPRGIRVRRTASSSSLSCSPRTAANLRKARRDARRTQRVQRARGRSRVRAINAFVSRRKCVRRIPRGEIRVDGTFGRNSVPFDGTVEGRRLSPGPYRATVVAKDAAGNPSSVRSRTFTVLPG